MIKDRIKGGIVLVSSTLGLMGMVGYAQYSPTKFALRGLAESLYQELLPLGIAVHIYFVATIDSPGHLLENATKPEITRILEEGDLSNPSPESRARRLIEGVQAGRFSIASDLVTDVIRCTVLGASPGYNYLYERSLALLGNAALPLWKWHADRTVRAHHKRARASDPTATTPL